MKTKSRSYGQSIFEVILAVGFIGIVLFAIVALVVATQRNTSQARIRAEAARAVQEGIEWLRGERDSDWSAFFAHSAGNSTWCLNSLNWNTQSACTTDITNKTYRREVTFTRDPVNTNTVRADVRVYWTDSTGAREIKSNTHFTNWKGL